MDLPGSVQLSIMGLPPMTYVNVAPERFPDGMRLALTRPGALVPDVDGMMPAGVGLLVIDPAFHAQLRASMRDAISKAEEAARANAARPS